VIDAGRLTRHPPASAFRENVPDQTSRFDLARRRACGL
jgi:hypothetical protein